MRPFISRRIFCRFAALGPLVAAIPPAKEEPSASLLYEQGVRMLREGRTFEKAATHFSRASEMEPKNADYQVALGCAYASRAASLAWAGAFGERLPLESAAYREVVTWLAEKEAEMRQKIKEGKANEDDIKKFEQGLAAYKQNLKPPSVQVILIKDDKAPYKQTRPELVAQLTELNQKAVSAWDKGIALAKTPEEKANAQYVRGWGMRLLQLYLSDESHWRFYLTSGATKPSQFRYYKAKPLPLELKGVPNDAQIKAALNEAAEGAPETALYKQAQADFLASKEQGDPGAEVTELYRKSALLDPRSANLWNRVYDRETKRRYEEKQSDAPFALADLHHAQARDKANAWYGYEESGRIMQEASWNRSDFLGSDATTKEQKAALVVSRTEAGYAAGKQAVALLERANALPRFAPPLYQNSVPLLLARAWAYVPNDWNGESWTGSLVRFQDMGRSVRFYAQSLAADKSNAKEAARVLRVLQKAGLRIMGDPWPSSDLVDAESNRQFTWAISGSILVNSAYYGWEEIEKNNPDALANVIRESDEWKARVKAWLAQMPEDFTPNLYDVYDRN